MLKDGEKGVILQRDRETYAIAPHLVCGLVTPEILRKIAHVAERYDVAALKLTGAQRLALVGIKEKDIDAVWRDLGMEPGYAVGLCVRSIKCCPGTAFCKRGLQNSLSLAKILDEKYHGMGMPSKFKIGVSGCPNNCADSPVRDLGFTGLAKGWRIWVGGNVGRSPRIADNLIDNVSPDEVLEIADKVVNFYKENAKPRERLGRLVERIGLENLKTEILGPGP